MYFDALVSAAPVLLQQHLTRRYVAACRAAHFIGAHATAVVAVAVILTAQTVSAYRDIMEFLWAELSVRFEELVGTVGTVHCN